MRHKFHSIALLLSRLASKKSSCEQATALQLSHGNGGCGSSGEGGVSGRGGRGEGGNGSSGLGGEGAGCSGRLSLGFSRVGSFIRASMTLRNADRRSSKENNSIACIEWIVGGIQQLDGLLSGIGQGLAWLN